MEPSLQMRGQMPNELSGFGCKDVGTEHIQRFKGTNEKSVLIHILMLKFYAKINIKNNIQ